MFEIFSFKHEISSVALLINHFCFDYLVFFIADNLIKNFLAPNHYFFITKVCNLLRYKLFGCLYSFFSFSSILFSCSRDKTLASCFLLTFLAILRKVSGVGFSSVVNQNKKRKLPKDRELNFMYLTGVG